MSYVLQLLHADPWRGCRSHAGQPPRRDVGRGLRARGSAAAIAHEGGAASLRRRPSSGTYGGHVDTGFSREDGSGPTTSPTPDDILITNSAPYAVAVNNTAAPIRLGRPNPNYRAVERTIESQRPPRSCCGPSPD